MTELNKLTYESCKQFLALEEGDKVKIVKVYDGDTVTAAFIRNGIPVKFRCRLEGIDTPELHSSDAHEKALAVKARDALSALTLNKVVTVKSPSLEKYGRILCDLEVDGKSACDEMMALHDVCYAYDGGSKKQW